jgi:hypothetical protein
LVAWGAFWGGDADATARLAAVRADAAAEPLLAAVWTLRMSKDALALDRAQKLLTESPPLGPVVVGLALRDGEFRAAVTRFRPTVDTFALWHATLVSGHGSRPNVARGLAQLWSDFQSRWEEDTWRQFRVLDEKRCAALESLLDHPNEEVRGALAAAMAETYFHEAHWLGELLLRRLEDRAVGTVACRWVQHSYQFPKNVALERLRNAFSDRFVHRVDFLTAMANLGDPTPAMTHFRSVTPKEQRALLAPLSISAPGKRFIEAVVRDENAARSLRRDAYFYLDAKESLAEFAWLATTND